MGKWKIYRDFPLLYRSEARSTEPMWVLEKPSGFKWYYLYWDKAVHWLNYHLQLQKENA
jgi:hypothetical protein